jgi:hypothetical protein
MNFTTKNAKPKGKKNKNQPHKTCKLPKGLKKSMTFAKCNKLCNKFNINTNNNIMKILQIAKNCARTQEIKSSLTCDKIMQQSCTLLTTTLLPLFSFSFFFSHVGASLLFQKNKKISCD